MVVYCVKDFELQVFYPHGSDGNNLQIRPGFQLTSNVSRKSSWLKESYDISPKKF